MPNSKIAPRLDRIRALNDVLRAGGTGRIVLSLGVSALDLAVQQRILREIMLFDDFTDDNDPYGEHDCAIVAWEAYRVLFKISYYDLNLECHSEDPADPNKTIRVMTVMFPEEY